MKKARYIMIGGFLGAGKTTSIQAFGSYLVEQGLRVGLITNDQGWGLVDSTIGRANAFPVEEIGGGCFCCRFNSLLDAARNLTEKNRPDLLLAEPVGSCTDLVATVGTPLRQIYGDQFHVAPFSVLVDPVRALRILGLEDGKRFSSNVRYIYLKQLEEAELLVINKTDLLAPERLDLLRYKLHERYPDTPLFEVSARERKGLEPWFSMVLSDEVHARPGDMDLDYGRYGAGEALLGWLNAELELIPEDGEIEFDGNRMLLSFASKIQSTLEKDESEIAHLKLTLTPRHDPYEVAAVHLVTREAQPELSHRLVDPLIDGRMLVNIRAETSPDLLEDALQTAVRDLQERTPGIGVRIRHVEHFRPGMPEPTHRMTSGGEADPRRG
jgi:G3E family GTPase